VSDAEYGEEVGTVTLELGSELAGRIISSVKSTYTYIPILIARKTATLIPGFFPIQII
jgi:hypothetical protein